MLSRWTSTSSPASTQITWFPAAVVSAAPLADVPASRTAIAGGSVDSLNVSGTAGGGQVGGGWGGGGGGGGGSWRNWRASSQPMRMPIRRMRTNNQNTPASAKLP